jgi:hypothetical protein
MPTAVPQTAPPFADTCSTFAPHENPDEVEKDVEKDADYTARATDDPSVGIYDVTYDPTYCCAPQTRTSSAALVPVPHEFALPSLPIVKLPDLAEVVKHLVQVVPLYAHPQAFPEVPAVPSNVTSMTPLVPPYPLT